MNQIKPGVAILLLLVLSACRGGSRQPEPQAIVIDTITSYPNQFLTREDRSKLIPDSVLQLLKEGNQRFIRDSLTVRNHTERRRLAALGQYPKAMILSCMDSRVPVEDVFDRGIGDIFVARVAGNIVNADIVASMEYGCKVSGAKLILVLGHEFCGAIKAAIDNEKIGNITALLAKIRPAMITLTAFQGERSSSNPDYVHAVCIRNIRLAIQAIRNQSDILRNMEKNGEIKITGAIYNMETGLVDFE